MSVPSEVYAWLLFVLGLFIGSFLNVVAYRVPRQESIVWPGSHCPTCNHSLSPWELIPVLSWLVLRGRCRHCKVPIPGRYPLLEMTTAGLFAATVLAFPDWKLRIAYALLWTLLGAVLGTDMTSMRVPNVISYPAALLMPIVSIVSGAETWQRALGGAAVSFTVLFAIHLISGGNMGMGDAKLYWSIGAMLGALYAMESLVFASMVGALIGGLLRITGVLKKREYIPFVPYIMVGVVIAVFFGHPLTHWYLFNVVGF